MQSSIKPIPQDVSIPVLNGTEKGEVHGWYFAANSAVKKNRLIVHFHGNGQNLTTHFLFFRWMIDYGYDYLIFDYRGYGSSSGESASQQKTVEDGEAVFKYVHENFSQDKVVAIGQSLGSNVLVRTLQEINRKNQNQLLPQFVVLDSSFLSYQSAASEILSSRWFLYPLIPFSYVLISDEWSAKSQLKFTPKLPALFLHGTQDQTISFEQGKKNFDLWPGPKVFSTQDGGGHTSAFSDRRFLSARAMLLDCIEAALESERSFEKCGKD